MADRTWNSLIEDAFIEIGVLEDGEQPEPTDLNRGLIRLQEMLDGWALDGLMEPAISHIDHEVTESKQRYTISTRESDNPDILAEAPPVIATVTYKHLGDTDGRPIIPTSYVVWAEIQSSDSECPNYYYYQKSHPIAEILFDARTVPGDSFKISGRGYLVPETLNGTELTGLPRGYNRAIVYNLAVEMAPSYGVKDGLSVHTIKSAKDAKNEIRMRNVGKQVARLDRALVRNEYQKLYPSGYGW